MATVETDTAHTDATPRVASAFQREEVEAAVRGANAEHLDARGVAAATEAAAQLVRALGNDVVGWRNFRDETTVVVTPAGLVAALSTLRDKLGFALLSDISPRDTYGATTEVPLAQGKRFSVSYVVTKLEAGAPRVRVQVWVDEGESLPSALGIYPTADWHEREAFDFFGIEFTGREGLRRLIMADDWEGHPLRKDYPLGGEPVKFTNSLREL